MAKPVVLLYEPIHDKALELLRQRAEVRMASGLDEEVQALERHDFHVRELVDPDESIADDDGTVTVAGPRTPLSRRRGVLVGGRHAITFCRMRMSRTRLSTSGVPRPVTRS